MPYYAVARGYQVGIFTSWDDCQKQVKGFKNAIFKKFQTLADAESFIASNSNSTNSAEVNADPMNHNMERVPTNSASLDASLLYDDIEGDNDLLLALSTLNENSNNNVNRNAASGSQPKNTALPKKRVKIGHNYFMMDSDGFVEAYIGGHYENIGSWNCVAGLGVYFGDKHPLNMAEPATGRLTRNVADIEAAIYAIKTAIDVGITKLCLHTSSEFLLKAVTSWIFNWKRNGWRNKNGNCVQNRKEFEKLVALLDDDRIVVKWENVNGNRQEFNSMKQVQKLATMGTDEYLELHPTKDPDNDISDDDFDFFF